MKPKFIWLAPLPPPFGGMTIITKSFFEAGIEEKIDIRFLDLSKKTKTESFGKITLTDVVVTLKNFLLLKILCLKSFSYKNAFLIATCDTGILRDLFYVIILKFFGKRIFLNLHGTRKIKNYNFLIQNFTKAAMNLSYMVLSPTMVDLDGINNFYKKSNPILFYNSTFIKYDFEPKILNNEFIYLVGTGRFCKNKGSFDLFNTVLELLNNGSKIVVRWIGSGAFPEDDKWGDEFIKKAGDMGFTNSFQIYRNISDNQKFEILNSSDLFVLPSYSDNLPIAILEAMAFGLPVLSTTIGAIPEVIADGKNGFLFEPGNTSKLKDLIVFCSQNKKLLNEIGINNKKDFSAKFSTVQRINELINYSKE